MSDSPFGIPHKRGDCYATWYIRRKAKELAGKYGFDDAQLEDIGQELALHLLRQWSLFESAKGGMTTFIQNVVDGMVCQLLRDQRRFKRDYRTEMSLSDAGAAAEYGLLDGARGQAELSVHEHMELQTDCADILAQLPDDLREIAERLKDQCPLEIARELGIPKTTLMRRIAELREHFKAAGYGESESTNLNEEN
jgi:RNA polymerase sigma factor (sigma-70 family)